MFRYRCCQVALRDCLEIHRALRFVDCPRRLFDPEKVVVLQREFLETSDLPPLFHFDQFASQLRLDNRLLSRLNHRLPFAGRHKSIEKHQCWQCVQQTYVFQAAHG